MNRNLLLKFLLFLYVTSTKAQFEENVTYIPEERFDQITLKILREILRRLQYPKHSIRKNCYMPNNIYGTCAEIQKAGCELSGIYEILLILPSMDYKTLMVYCDLDTDGGGWTLIQKRGEFGHPHTNFGRGWFDYVDGFGDITQEYWLGNDNIHALTYYEDVDLRIDLEDFSGNKNYQFVNFFRVGNSDSEYELIRGEFIKSAGIILPNRTKFVTHDRDFINCPIGLRGGWWREGLGCELSTLNGKFPHGKKYMGTSYGMFYERWREFINIISCEIKIRPTWFIP